METPTPETPEPPKPASRWKRDPGEQRYIIRQTAIKCAVDLASAGKIPVVDLFKFSGRIVAWIYSSPRDPTGSEAPQ